VGKYQKLHMFDVDTPEFKFRESDVVERGTNLGVPLKTPIGQMGLQIVSESVVTNGFFFILPSLPYSVMICGSPKQVSF
jgi:hypothetical protein